MEVEREALSVFDGASYCQETTLGFGGKAPGGFQPPPATSASGKAGALRAKAFSLACGGGGKPCKARLSLQEVPTAKL